MAMEAPESGTLFCHVPLKEALYGVVVGRPASYRTHWVKGKSGRVVRSIRCVAGDDRTCVACGQGRGYNVRYMIPIRVGDVREDVPLRDERGRVTRVLIRDAQVRMFECGRPQYGWVSIRQQLRDWVGHEFRARRENPARNSIIICEGIGWQEVPEDDQVHAEEQAEVEGLAQYEAWVLDQQDVRFSGIPAPLGLDGR